MNDEYLWQKTGEDPEIVRLEDALAVYSYRETVPPVIPVVAAPRRWRSAATFAVPAFAAAVAIGVVWFQSANSGDEITFVHHPDVEQSDIQIAEPQPVTPAVTPSEPPRQPLHRGKNTQSAVLDRRKNVTKTNGRKRNAPVFTKEELYAYEQLMLALSISSSSLNVVRDTINGVDGSVSKQNNR